MSLRTGKFTQRNSFYLRISSTTVLQLLLLLDARHVDWMSSEILEKVLNVLRTHIATKLGAEGGTAMNVSKKRREADSEKIDVFRGAGWQMAYYFRKQVHRHAVLLKQITFEPIVKEAPRPPPSSVTRKKRKHIAIDIPDDDGDEEENRTDIVPVVKEEDVEEEEQQPLFRPDFEDEDEDEKPEGKPKLRVSYDGFSIFGKLLVVIVEPYPPLRGQSRASVRPDERELSVAPSPARNPRTREESEFAVPQAPGRGTSRQRSESSIPLRSADNPLFRPETPVPDDEDEEGLDGFRARSQSILGYNPSLEGTGEE